MRSETRPFRAGQAAQRLLSASPRVKMRRFIKRDLGASENEIFDTELFNKKEDVNYLLTRFSSKHQSFLLTRFLNMLTRYAK